MHVNGFVRGKGKFIVTEYVATDEKTGPRFPLLLTTGRILSQYNVGAQTRRTDNSLWHKEDLLEIHPHDAEQRGIRDGDWVELAEPRRRDDAARATHRPRGAGRRLHDVPSPDTQANVITTDYSDWATNCPEYKVTAVQVSPSNGPSRWQEDYERAQPHRAGASLRRSRPRSSLMREPTAAVATTIWRRSGVTDGERTIPEETAVAFTYDGGSYAVMMATPRDLEDFALGFSFTEGVISSPADIKQLEIVEHESGDRAADVAGRAARRSAERAPPLSRRSDRLRALRHRQPD